MASSLIGIGITGLNAAMGAVRTTQHNIANANTPGYHRQAVQLAANPPTYTGAGFFGNGVAITTVARIYSQFLDNELMRSQGQLARHEVYAAYASQIDRLLGDQNSGLNSALSAFFAAVQEVANDPTSMAAREAMLAAGRNLAGRMNNLGRSLEEMQARINGEMASIASQANAYLRRIANLNDRIALLQAMGGNPPNDLLDQREQLTAELNKLMDVSVIRGGDGAYNLYLGGGQPLLIGNQPNLLGVADDPYYSRVKTLTLGVGGATLTLDSQLVKGGRLGGLLALREEVLHPAMQDLGVLAIGLADQFNRLHRAGFALDGETTGVNFFSVPSFLTPRSDAGNTGDAVFSLSLSSSENLRWDDYSLSYDGTNFVLTRASDGVNYTATSLTTLNDLLEDAEGFTLNLTNGTLAAGDSFEFEMRHHLVAGAASGLRVVVRNPEQIAAGGPVVTAAANSNTGNATIDSGSVVLGTTLPLSSPIILTYISATNQITVSGATPAVGPFTYVSGSVIDINGIRVVIRGTPANGDTFTIANGSGGPGDNRMASLMAGLQTYKVFGGTPPSSTITDIYSKTVSRTASHAAEADIAVKAYDSLTRQAFETQQSLSGVNLDEEAANLIRYQQAYQAAARAMQVASSLLDELLAIGR